MNTINRRRSTSGISFDAVTLPSTELAASGNHSGIPEAHYHSLRWRAAIGDVHSVPTAASGSVYIGTMSGMLHAINSHTGRIRWQVELAGATSSPVVLGDIVFVNDGSRLYALDAADGCEVWSAVLDGNAVFSDVTTDDGVLYAGDSEGYVHAINPPTGDRFWHSHVGSVISSAPAVDGDLVYVRANDGTVSALHTATGEVMWQVQGGWTFSPSGPIVTEGVVVSAESGGTFQALDADTGIRRWTAAAPGVTIGSPVATRDAVIVATELPTRTGMVTAFDPRTGAVRWQVEIEAALASGLRTVGNTVYFGDAGGAVRLLDASSGAEVWSYTRCDGQPASAPFILAHVLYLGSTVSTPVFSPDLSQLLGGAQQAGTVRAYRLRLSPN